jgi:chromosomal replication initiator protein
VSEKSSKTVDIKSSWDRTLSVLRAELGEATFRSWFKHIEFGEFNEKKLVLYVPTKFMKDWIHTHYSDRILSILKMIICQFLL